MPLFLSMRHNMKFSICLFKSEKNPYFWKICCRKMYMRKLRLCSLVKNYRDIVILLQSHVDFITYFEIFKIFFVIFPK